MLVTTENFQEAIDFLQGCDILTCDTETNYVKFDCDRHIIGVACLGVNGSRKAYYFPFRHEHEMQRHENDVNLPIELLPVVLNLIGTKRTIWHNGIFDLQQIEKEEIDWDVNEHFYYDTLNLSHMENENKFSHELEALAPLVKGKKLGKELDEIAIALGGGGKNKAQKEAAKAKGWVKIPPSTMDLYAAEKGDVQITWDLFKLFLPRIQQQELIELYSRENRVSHMVRRMIQRGVGSSRSALEQKVIETQHEILELLDELGYEPGKPAQLAHRLYALPPAGLGFRPESFSKRPSKEFSEGIPNMDEDTLARLDHPEVKKVLRYRSLVQDLSMYYGAWLENLDPSERIHAAYKQHGTVTTRWTCSKPNLNQLPRDEENKPIKKMLRAKEGYELWEFDYSQMEFRLAVVYVDSKKFRKLYDEGIDVHATTAQEVGAYNQFPNNPSQARYVGKQMNFLIINRGGPAVLKKQLWHNGRIDLPLGNCKAIHKAWHEENPEFEEFAAKVEQAARSRGFIKLWNGRIRHFDPKGYDHRAAFNSLIQGGAAQITVESMLELDKQRIELVGQVYDSIWCELPEAVVEEQKELIINTMSWPTKSFEFPFEVDCKRLA